MHEINKQKFGAFVAQLRREKGLTQKDLAEKLFISDKAISKWETGVSIPDVSLLIPLSEVLDVTVTELLQCSRIAEQSTMEPEQVEDLVKAAITLSDEDAKKRQPNWKRRLPIFVLVLAVAAVETAIVSWLCWPSPQISSNLIVMEFMLAFFAGYFLLFMQEKLPKYYDENRIQYFSDGFLRMNVPGITFNNRNWPHIRKAGTVSCLAILLGYPIIFLISELFIPEQWTVVRIALMLVPILGGLFIPMYIAGKKYQ